MVSIRRFKYNCCECSGVERTTTALQPEQLFCSESYTNVSFCNICIPTAEARTSICKPSAPAEHLQPEHVWGITRKITEASILPVPRATSLDKELTHTAKSDPLAILVSPGHFEWVWNPPLRQNRLEIWRGPCIRPTPTGPPPLLP